jgi:predicted DNA-binding transcriptional regulator AlpA
MTSNFNEEKAFLRIKDIVKPDGMLPISRTTWLTGVRTGKFPAPIKHHLLGERITLWDVQDIKELIAKIKGEGKVTAKTPTHSK